VLEGVLQAKTEGFGISTQFEVEKKSIKINKKAPFLLSNI